MPRHDWNTPENHTPSRNHKAMKSAHPGKGGDAKIRAAKKQLADVSYHKPAKKQRREEPE